MEFVPVECLAQRGHALAYEYGLFSLYDRLLFPFEIIASISDGANDWQWSFRLICVIGIFWNYQGVSA